MKNTVLKAVAKVAIGVIAVSVLSLSIAAAEPVIKFSFDESVAADAGATLTSDGKASIAEGKIGNALKLDANSKANISVVSNFNDLKEATIMAWIKTEGTIGDYYCIFAGPWSDTYVHFNVVAIGITDVGVNKTTVLENGRRSVSKVNDGKWHHVAYVFDTVNSNMKIYIDGKLDAENKEYKFLVDNGLNFSQFNIGSWNNSRYYNGLIDELMIYGSMLTQDEIKAVAGLDGTEAEADVEETKSEDVVNETKTEDKLDETKTEEVVDETKTEDELDDTKAEEVVDETKTEDELDDTKAEEVVDETKTEDKLDDTKAEDVLEETPAESTESPNTVVPILIIAVVVIALVAIGTVMYKKKKSSK